MKIKIKRKIGEQNNLAIEEIINLLLKDRGIKNKEEFLNPKYPKDISFGDFFSKKSLAKVIKKLKEIKKTDKMIIVYTDYDADGITGGAILWETLHLLGFKTMPYVPHRQLEGYGFSKIGIDTIKELYDPSLIISVDHGISAVEKISYARSLGIPIIVTDHHIKAAKKPKEALAIFHTDKLSGAGVAYFLAKEIFNNFKKYGQDTILSLQNNFQTDYLALASIGTIADLVPLLGSSRSITKYGLESFPKVKRYGIRHVLKEAGIEDRKITPYEIGFIIAPRINALGRLEHAIDALRLLCTTKEEKAQMLAAKMGEKNRERQDILEKAVEEAKEKLAVETHNYASLPKIIILSSNKWHEGIIGLIASKLVDEFYRPTIIMSIGDDFVKGSARSIPGFDITTFIRSVKSGIIDVGGHKGAAGFTIEKSKISIFTRAATTMVNRLIKDKDLEKTIIVDLKIPLSKANLSLACSLEKLQPFGVGNPQPLFYSEGELAEAKLFGRNNEHLKIYLKDESSLLLEFVFFNQGQDFLNLSRGQKMGVVYNLEIDRWGGKEKIRGRGKLIK
jgi:single-stranded-DNA-specific exonuclease